MAESVIRPAREDDSRFLAWVMQEADRGHTGIGSWDVLIPGVDEKRLAILEDLAREGEGTYCHWPLFLIAEVDGVAAAAVARYVPEETPHERFLALLRGVTRRRGWLEQRLAEGLRGAYSKDYFTVPIPPGTWRVEWAATRPEYRGRGLNHALLSRLLALGRERGHRTSHVGTYLGNEPAIAAYKSAGFEVYAEARHADYERVFGAAGLIFLRRDL